MKKTLPLILLAAFSAPLRAGDAQDADYTGIISPYSDALEAIARAWPPDELQELKRSFENDKERGALICFSTPGNELYIGAAQYHRIAAPFDRTAAVLDDFAGHAGITSDLLVSRVDKQDGGRRLVFSEQYIGIPFVRNEKDEVVFRITEQKSPLRKFYRYQLKESIHLKTNDGLIVLEPAGTGETDYTKFTFFDARWGLARAFSHGMIWKGSLRGIVQAALAIRLKAEHPDWEDARVLKKSVELSRAVKAEDCLKNRRPLPLPGAPGKETLEE